MASHAVVSSRDLWAKTDRDQPEKWLPLPNHLIDVASVALEMWETTLSLSAKQRWAAFFDTDFEAAGRWLAFLAGNHDIGKASLFQAASKEQRERLRSSGLPIRHQPLHPTPHGVITAATLPDLLRQRWPHLQPRIARRYAAVTGMHHGSLIDARSLGNASPKQNMGEVGNDLWVATRQQLFDTLLDILGPLPDPPNEPLPHPLATWTAGFISVVDWIGSNTTYFPIAPRPSEPHEALADARERARCALDDLGWASNLVSVPESFVEAFRYKGWTSPNATQRATIDAVMSMDGPGMVILEAPMGDGKTEAAFWVANHAQRHWHTRGLYVAMPTRASSDQIFQRLRDHLSAHAGGEKINLLLLHGHAAISSQLELVRRREGVFDPAPAAPAPESSDDNLLRVDWFSARKRGLMAPYGVGTVDQTLLGILENRHYFVRLHGLSGKTIIFDEVHAYDTYMETLFAGELEALGALGTPVMILSATLPRERRDALLDAYARGAGWHPQPDDAPVDYPRVTTIDRTRVNSVPIERSGREHTVDLRWFPGAEEEARNQVADALTETLTGNTGTCSVICNTVGQAQSMFSALDARFPGEVDLFHARFRLMDRAERQERVLESFGKDHSVPERRIVVATQVIEQSLDLDFDLMISYFCPTDLLIQRIGRLHRHDANNRNRPQSLLQPQLWVLGVGDAAGDYPSLGVPYVSRLIYDPHVLIRSWAVLRNQERLDLPSDIEPCIEQTYRNDAEAPADLLADWNRSKEEFRERVGKERASAERLMIPALHKDAINGGKDPLIRNVGEKTPEDEQKQEMDASAIARTRDGPPSVDVVLLTPDEDREIGPLAASGKASLPLKTVAKLLSRSVSISQVGPYRALMAHDPPKEWQRTSWLQRHRLLRLDDRNRVQLGNYTIEVSPTLGVVITQPGPPEEE